MTASISSRALCLLFSILFGGGAMPWAASAADGPRQRDNGIATPLQFRPAERPDVSDARERLGEKLKALDNHLEILGAALDRLKESDDGSPEAGARIQVVSLLLVKDTVVLSASADPAITRLTWSLTINARRQRGLAKRRAFDVQRVGNEIEDLADRITRLEDGAGGSGESTAAATTRRQIMEAKEELEELLLLSGSHSNDAGAYLKQATEYDEELRSLSLLTGRLQAKRRILGVRARRLAAGVQRAAIDSLCEEVNRDRALLRKAIALVDRSARDVAVPPRRARRVVDQGVSTSTALERAAKTSAVVDSERLVEAINKSRKRRSDNNSSKQDKSSTDTTKNMESK